MPAPVATDSVWREIEKRSFAVLAMVTPTGEARSAGIVYTARDRLLYVGSDRESLKVRWIEANPHVSLTVTIAKRVPFAPWVQIPAATITFQADAEVLAMANVDEDIRAPLTNGLELDALGDLSAIRITPRGRFLTYGIGVPLLAMRDPEKARGAAPV